MPKANIMIVEDEFIVTDDLDLTIREGIVAKEIIRKLEMLDPQVKAIVSSGYSNDPVIKNFMRYGFKGAIPKPCPMKELKKIMHEVIMDV